MFIWQKSKYMTRLAYCIICIMLNWRVVMKHCVNTSQNAISHNFKISQTFYHQQFMNRYELYHKIWFFFVCCCYAAPLVSPITYNIKFLVSPAAIASTNARPTLTPCVKLIWDLPFTPSAFFYEHYFNLKILKNADVLNFHLMSHLDTGKHEITLRYF